MAFLLETYLQKIKKPFEMLLQITIMLKEKGKDVKVDVSLVKVTNANINASYSQIVYSRESFYICW